MRYFHVEEWNWTKIYFKLLQVYFPELTYDDFVEVYEGADAEEQNWLEQLHGFLYDSTYREAFKMYYHKCCADFDAADRELTSFRFYCACIFLQKAYPVMFKHYTPDMTSQWVQYHLNLSIVGGNH